MENKKLLLCLFLTFLAISAYSQLEINSSGKIGIGGWPANNSYEIYGNRSYYSNSYSNYQRTSYSYVYESAGIGTNYSSEYTLIVSPLGSVRNVLYISDGDNKSTGSSLYVNGDAWITGQLTHFSDRRLKKKERRIQRNNILSKLTKVHGKRYEYKTRKELIAMHNAGEASFPIDTIYKTKKIINEQGDTIRIPTKVIKRIRIDVPKFKKGESYGLAAQDVLAEYPELVTVDESSGMMGVDYRGFIPLLLEGFNIQQEQMLEMQKKIQKLKKDVKILKENNGN
jgi:hypothetical protein